MTKISSKILNDLRYPLNEILSLLQIVEKKTKNVEVVKGLAQCKNILNAITKLVNDSPNLNSKYYDTLRPKFKDFLDVLQTIEKRVNNADVGKYLPLGRNMILLAQFQFDSFIDFSELLETGKLRVNPKKGEPKKDSRRYLTAIPFPKLSKRSTS
jgi:hypothetical protein